MTTFATRLTAARTHETNVLRALLRDGWDAEPFGQGQLTDTMRTHLRHHDPVTPVRWLPDILAARVTPAGLTRVVYVDAKAGDTWRETGNHDVELAALETAEAWRDWSRCPVYFVFTNGAVATPERVRELAEPGYWRGNGSGTPFVLFPALACEAWASKFGPQP